MSSIEKSDRKEEIIEKFSQVRASEPHAFEVDDAIPKLTYDEIVIHDSTSIDLSDRPKTEIELVASHYDDANPYKNFLLSNTGKLFIPTSTFVRIHYKEFRTYKSVILYHSTVKLPDLNYHFLRQIYTIGLNDYVTGYHDVPIILNKKNEQVLSANSNKFLWNVCRIGFFKNSIQKIAFGLPADKIREL